MPHKHWIINGGYLWHLARGTVKTPAIFGAHATPTLLVYDRGGYATATLKVLAHEVVKQLGIQPKGQRAWARCRGRPADGQERTGQDRRDHWYPEDGQIWVQQAQGTSVADAGDGRYLALSSPSI